MNSRRSPPTSSVSSPSKRPMPWSWWTTRSPIFRSRKSERKLRARLPRPRWRWTSSGKRSPSARTVSAAVGELEAGAEDADAEVDGRPRPDGEAVLAQDVAQALGPAGGAEEQHRRALLPRRGRRTARAGRRRSAAPAGWAGARRAGRGPPRARGATALPRSARPGPPPGTSASAGSRASASGRRARSSRARAWKASASSATLSGSRTTVVHESSTVHGATVAPGTSGSRSARSSTTSAPRSIFSRSAGRSRWPAKRSGSARRRPSSTERGAKTSVRGRISRLSSAAVVRWVSGSKLRRVSTVSPRNSMRTGASRSGGNTSRIPPRRATWPGRGDGVLAAVPAFVEHLEQDLRRHLVAGGDRDHPRLEQARLQHRPQQPRRRRDPGAEAPVPRGMDGGGAAERGVRVAGQPAEGRRAGRREGQHRARGARPPGPACAGPPRPARRRSRGPRPRAAGGR